MRLKIFLTSLIVCFFISNTHSMDIAQRQEEMLTHVAKILGNAVENQLNERYRSPRASNEAAKQYVNEQF